MADMNPEFLINPSFRLSSRYLSVRWHTVPADILEAEGAFELPGRHILCVDGKVEVIVQHSVDTLDAIYSPDSDFSSPDLQEKLRKVFKLIITTRANEILPARVRYWENLTGLHGNGVKVIRMRKNILGCCTSTNEIHLPPYLVIFKEEWMDGVILHEMAHYRFKHHRKPFWDFLSQLIGADSRKAKVKDDIALSPYYEYYCYLTR